MRLLFYLLTLFTAVSLPAQGMTVALMIPTDGPLAPMGHEFLAAFRQGLTGPVTVRVWNTRGDPQRVQQYWQALAYQPQISLVIGPLTSGEIRALLQSPPVSDVVVYSPLALDPEQCRAPFPLYGPVIEICEETRFLAQTLRALQLKNLLVLSPRAPRPLARYLALQTLLTPQDFGSVHFALYPEDSLALHWLDPLLDTVNTEALILCGAGPTGVALADYARGIGFHGKVFAFKEWLRPENRALATFTDSVFVVTLDPDRARNRSLSVDLAAFQQRFADSTGAPPGPVALQGYLAGVIVSQMTRHHLQPGDFFHAYPTTPVSGGFQLLFPQQGFIKLVLLRKGTLKEVTLQ